MTETTGATIPAASGRASRRKVHFVSGVALLLAAVGMVGWIVILASTLRNSVRVHNWSATWVGLDIVELIMLVVIGIALIKRHPYTDVFAAVGATLFAFDAWFDVMLAGGRTVGESILLACVAEIPITLALALVAWKSRHWFSEPRRVKGDNAPVASPAASAEPGDGRSGPSGAQAPEGRYDAGR